MSTTPTATSAPDHSRRIAIRALLILVAITVVLAIATGVYLFTRPSYAGTWVGPGVVQGTGDPNAIVVSLSLEQNPLGGINGTGTLCAATSGSLTRIPLTASGNLSGSSASLTLRASEGDTAIFPQALTAEGNLGEEGQLTLTAESPAHLLLTLQHGSASDFSAACNQLIQPASGG